MTAYFVDKEIIDFEDEEKVHNTKTLPDKSSIILRKVSYHLQSGVTKSLFAMLDIILQRGDMAGKEIALQMKQELSGPQGNTMCTSLYDVARPPWSAAVAHALSTHSRYISQLFLMLSQSM